MNTYPLNLGLIFMFFISIIYNLLNNEITFFKIKKMEMGFMHVSQEVT
jgi:hypothetical protein